MFGGALSGMPAPDHMRMHPGMAGFAPGMQIPPGVPMGGLRLPPGMMPGQHPWLAAQQAPAYATAANGRPGGLKAEPTGGWVWAYGNMGQPAPPPPPPPPQWQSAGIPPQWHMFQQQMQQQMPRGSAGATACSDPGASGSGIMHVKRELDVREQPASTNPLAEAAAVNVPQAAVAAADAEHAGNESAGSGGSVGGLPQALRTAVAPPEENPHLPRFCFQCGKMLKRAGAPFCSICGSAQI